MALYRVKVLVEFTTYAHDDYHARETVERATRVDPMLARIENMTFVDARVDQRVPVTFSAHSDRATRSAGVIGTVGSCASTSGNRPTL